MLGTILIVDGDVAQLNMLERAISEKLQYKTVTTASLVEAGGWFLTARQPIPDVLLLDMRTENNEECLQLIRSIKVQNPNFPVIIITEYGDHEYATMAINAGANDFLTKPLTIARLELSIANAMKIRNLHQKLKALEQKLLSDGVPLQQIPAQKKNSVSLLDDGGKVKKLRVLEDDVIRFALDSCGGSMSKTARMLGIGRSTLYRKLGEVDREAHNVRESQTTRPTISNSPL